MTVSVVKRFLLVSTLLANSAGAAIAAEGEPAADSAVVAMAAYKVTDYSLNIGYHLRIASSRKTGLITGVVFSRIDAGSLSEEAGLRAGDRLVAIAGKPVEGLKRPELHAALKLTIKNGETGEFLFKITRGILRRPHEVKLTIKTSPQEGISAAR